MGVGTLDVFNENNVLAVESHLLTAKDTDQKYIYRFLKRMLDILSSIAGLIILSTLFLVIAITIKKEVENGPVFFSQIRIGKKWRKV